MEKAYKLTRYFPYLSTGLAETLEKKLSYADVDMLIKETRIAADAMTTKTLQSILRDNKTNKAIAEALRERLDTEGVV